jgi:hypothetical protein
MDGIGMNGNGQHKLDPADYWQLRAFDSDLAMAQQQAQSLFERRQQYWRTLAEKYKLDAQGRYRANDAETSLVGEGVVGP